MSIEVIIFLVKEQSIKPFLVNSQVDLDQNHFKKFSRDLHEISKYHSDPFAFVIGLQLAYIMRFREDSSFYQQLLLEKQKLNIPKPYVGVHVRRSDKSNEALFYEVDEYMVYVEEFFETYFLKHPEKANSTERAVYVASDEILVFGELISRFLKIL